MVAFGYGSYSKSKRQRRGISPLHDGANRDDYFCEPAARRPHSGRRSRGVHINVLAILKPSIGYPFLP